MPAKPKVTKEILIRIAVELYRPTSAEELGQNVGLSAGKVERLAARLRKQGAKIPKQPRSYKNSIGNMIAGLKTDHPEIFNG